MRATNRPTTGALAVLTAALALTACGTTTTDSKRDAGLTPCRTAALRWSLTLAGTDRGAGPAHARLTAVNKGPGSCVFDGYPGLEIHNGKADSIEGAGHGRPDPVPLPGKASLTVDLRYTPRGANGAGGWCVQQPEAVIRAPHDSGAAVVPVRDAHGKAAQIDACGDSITLAAPHRS
ncbi:DUF4232 domain-containing protein [Streptomyces sp. MMG1121]|uniref:DUF4232 domain-containing protein n=1 Tax=Streptomyces sp. MMG1121 TaxID=1415544 RepID=UPI0006AE9F21|nr:DUF4232 domain-containing protein [Streptomyces sp. MMG1121]KOV66925.1 hypothetical protein ADK64_10730 [Streptomyces sp. MMG1121]